MKELGGYEEDEKGHTAIVFFHGIGNPRKLGTLSNFLDELDLFGSTQDYQTLGVPRNFKHRAEESADGRTRNLVQFRRIKKYKQKHVQVKIFRAYEGYWGDDLAKRMSIIRFVFWLVQILYNSAKILTSPWRRYPLYRLRSLHLIDAQFSGIHTREKIEALYRRFSTLRETLKYPKGNFSEFEKFLAEREILTKYGDFRQLAKQWRFKERLDLAQFIATMLFVLSLLAVASLAGMYFLMAFFIQVLGETSISYLNAPVLALLTFSSLAWACWRPISQRISDVFFWSTYDERTDGFSIRERRINQAQELIWSIISNARCNDCIIVGHSLGSAIAMEALFRISERAEALDLTSEDKQDRLRLVRKIKFAFLAGSPIDNIFSLFQEDWGKSRRYSRIQEQRAPNLKSPSFKDSSSELGLTVVNFWSRFDPISARIFSLRTPDNHPRKMIHNSECLPFGAPFPLSAHSGYFQDRRLMRTIYHAVMTGRLDESSLRPELIRIEMIRWNVIVGLTILLTALFALVALVENVWLTLAILFLFAGCCCWVVWKLLSDLRSQAR